jgi:hypothetical protein
MALRAPISCTSIINSCACSGGVCVRRPRPPPPPAPASLSARHELWRRRRLQPVAVSSATHGCRRVCMSSGCCDSGRAAAQVIPASGCHAWRLCRLESGAVPAVRAPPFTRQFTSQHRSTARQRWMGARRARAYAAAGRNTGDRPSRWTACSRALAAPRCAAAPRPTRGVAHHRRRRRLRCRCRVARAVADVVVRPVVPTSVSGTRVRLPPRDASSTGWLCVVVSTNYRGRDGDGGLEKGHRGGSLQIFIAQGGATP